MQTRENYEFETKKERNDEFIVPFFLILFKISFILNFMLTIRNR